MKMKWIRMILSWMAVMAVTLDAEPPVAWSELDEREVGFERILDGESLEGWAGDFSGKEVVDGTLHWRSGGHLWTQAAYADFILRFEFKLSPGANNGLAIRWTGEGDPAYMAMCELQILDNEAKVYQEMDLDPRQLHGSAYGMAAARRGFLRPAGEWNYQEVVVVGSWIRVTLNGETILDTDLERVTEYLDDKPHPGKDRKSGSIGFAGHGDKHHLQFRNIRVKRLE